MDNATRSKSARNGALSRTHRSSAEATKRKRRSSTSSSSLNSSDSEARAKWRRKSIKETHSGMSLAK